MIYVYTNGGGMGVLASDALERLGIELEDTPEDMKEKLKKVLPYFASLKNPIDTTANATEDQYVEGLRILIEDNRTEAILAILLPQLPHYTEKIVDKIKEVCKKNIFITFVIYGGFYADKIRKELEGFFPVFESPEEAAKALKFYLSKIKG
ncbi:hypothetical protein BA065_02230 [Nanoarchaeota archaeon NZ13-N]|nr:MAG: hypothetical protein BA065_02230 [Nanoarchaeota archaeon NZ13-N]